jgi:Fe2+ or Zn2+ uptake regulation protein
MPKQEQKNRRQSKQRNRILELLRSTESHPTADWLYQRLKKEFPLLSLGTVYRNLSTLIDQGYVKKIHFGSTYDRFEANVKPHYHLVCNSCGNIQDFKMPIYDELNEQAKRLTTFNIHHHNLEFFGLCENCSDKK